MKLISKDVVGIFKIFTGALASFLILYGIHWIAILIGVALAIVYFTIPKKYLH